MIITGSGGGKHLMSLDPKDWKAFRKSAHALLDASLDKLEASREGPVW